MTNFVYLCTEEPINLTTQPTMFKFILLSLALMAPNPTQDTPNLPTPSRCEAITKKGTRCKNKPRPNSKYCYVHQTKDSKVKKCKATTKAGTQCSRAAKIDGYCTQHYNMYKQGKL